MSRKVGSIVCAILAQTLFNVNLLRFTDINKWWICVGGIVVFWVIYVIVRYWGYIWSDKRLVLITLFNIGVCGGIIAVWSLCGITWALLAAFIVAILFLVVYQIFGICL
jgi:hypothetical protein